MHLFLTMVNSMYHLYLFGLLSALMSSNIVQGDDSCTDTMGRTIHCKKGTYCCMGASFCCNYDKGDGFNWRIVAGVVGGFVFLAVLLGICHAITRKNRRTAYARLSGPTVVVNQHPVTPVHHPPTAIGHHPPFSR